MRWVNHMPSLARSHSEDHKMLEPVIVTALPALYSFLSPTVTKGATFYRVRLSFPGCFASVWQLHLVCVFWIFHGIVRVSINLHHITIIRTESLPMCISVLFLFFPLGSFLGVFLFVCFCFLGGFFGPTYPVTCMIGRRIFQNLWLFNSHQNQIFPKP